MKAAFTLTLDDKLSSGLNTIKKSFEDLRSKGNTLGLGKLEKTEALFRTIGREIKNLTSDLRTVEATADRGWAGLKRMASVKFQGMEKRLFGKDGFQGPGHEVKHVGQIGAIGGAIAGVSLIKPAQDYATFENTLRHIAITEKLSGPAVEKEVARLTKNLKAEALATGQSSEGLSHAYTFLITTGMTPELVDKLMPSHAKAATAYNISSESMGQAVFALNDSFKIPHEEMGAALSAMAYAAKEAHFTVENFSQFLPAIGGRMQLLGMTGRGAADTAFAALETVVKNSSQPGQAATNFQDLMNYMTAPIATRSFAHQGINLPGSLIAAEKKGINPLDAFLGLVERQIKGKSPVEAAAIVGKLIHNQEAATAALSILQHKEEFMRMREKFGKVGADTLETDFQTAYRAPEIQIRSGKEAAEQGERRVGEGFMPIVDFVVDGLKKIVTGMDDLDVKFPGVTDGILKVTGGLLAMAAALAAVGFVAPAVAAGGSLVAGTAAGVGLFNPFSLITMPAAGIMLNAWKNAHAGENVDPNTQVQYNDPNGAPLPFPIDTASAKPDPQELHITLSADPGTRAQVTKAPPGISFSIPNAGQTTNRP